ncbi:MAG: LptF/LptG family permease [Candidatus Omnitrophica bacterium]|nr:LptF/LptG family permease [Candidatus Omnitrophota bacterium]
MRLLDRYAVRQLLPVWLWCLAVFTFLSCLIDLFEHLDEILRFRVPAQTILQYYLNFAPIVFVKASPLALLLASAFVAGRLSRHQEFLAMNASGTSLLRAAVPFLFVGWLATLAVLFVNDTVVPRSTAAYERIREDAFRGQRGSRIIQNVAMLDSMNRLYHARELDLKAKELHDLTVLEHDWNNRPTKSLNTPRAVWTTHGWLLLGGIIYRIGPGGTVEGEPMPFVDRLIAYPVTPRSFAEPEARPETMRFGQLRVLMQRLRQNRTWDLRKHWVELFAKVSLPLMNLVIGFIGFAGATQPQLRGNLKGLGTSLLWGLLYYLAVGLGQGIGKERLLWIPPLVAVAAPHAGAVWWCLRVIRKSP